VILSVKERNSDSHNPKVVGSNPAPATNTKAKALLKQWQGFCKK